jgi:hypothetical protein
MREPIARVVKNGEERLVHTRAELVELRFDGWREINDVVGKIRDGAEQLAGAFAGGVTATDPVDVTLPAGTDVVPGTSLNLDTDDDSPTDES